MDNSLCPDCGEEDTHALFHGLCPVVVVPVDAQPSTFWWQYGPDGPVVQQLRPCSHPDMEGTPLYRDGRKVWKCVTCEALLVHEDAAQVGAAKLVPLKDPETKNERPEGRS